jgi:hypothetical protein
MKWIIQLEELLMFAVSIYALYYFEAKWWFYLLLLLGPDISMLGYLAGNKVGAFTYNLFHHRGIAMIVFLLGWFNQIEPCLIIGVVLFGHSAMDRVFGYGLKYYKGFHYTHLGQIGPSKPISVNQL